MGNALTSRIDENGREIMYLEESTAKDDEALSTSDDVEMEPLECDEPTLALSMLSMFPQRSVLEEVMNRFSESASRLLTLYLLVLQFPEPFENDRGNPQSDPQTNAASDTAQNRSGLSGHLPAPARDRFQTRLSVLLPRSRARRSESEHVQAGRRRAGRGRRLRDLPGRVRTGPLGHDSALPPRLSRDLRENVVQNHRHLPQMQARPGHSGTGRARARIKMEHPTEEPSTIYCAKCQKHTKTCNPERNWTKTGSPMLKGECVVCGTRKSTFLKTRKPPCDS